MPGKTAKVILSERQQDILRRQCPHGTVATP